MYNIFTFDFADHFFRKMQTKLQSFFTNTKQPIVTSVEIEVAPADDDAVLTEPFAIGDTNAEVVSATNEVVAVESVIQLAGNLSNANGRVCPAGIAYCSMKHRESRDALDNLKKCTDC
jgi:hypothetical protein